MGDEISILDEALRGIETQLRQDMLWVPNLPHESVPTGPDDSFNIAYDPKGHPYLNLILSRKRIGIWGRSLTLSISNGESSLAVLDFICYEAGARDCKERLFSSCWISISATMDIWRFIRLNMVRSQMFEGAAQLPKFADNIYRDAEEDYMWLGTPR